MIKRYANGALAYAIVAMAGGVFYREFTRFSGFDGETTLSVLHTHYFLLGMFLFLLLALLEKAFSFSGEKRMPLLLYHVGLNITGLGLLLRGLAQVGGAALSRGMDAALSGLAGLGHILLGVGLVLLLARVQTCAAGQARHRGNAPHA